MGRGIKGLPGLSRGDLPLHTLPPASLPAPQGAPDTQPCSVHMGGANITAKGGLATGAGNGGQGGYAGGGGLGHTGQGMQVPIRVSALGPCQAMAECPTLCMGALLGILLLLPPPQPGPRLVTQSAEPHMGP